MANLVHRYGLCSRYDRLLKRGMLTKAEAAARLPIHVQALIIRPGINSIGGRGELCSRALDLRLARAADFKYQIHHGWRLLWIFYGFP